MLENVRAWTWNGMDRRISEMSEQGKHQSAERCQKTTGNVGNIGVWNRKASEYGKHRKTSENIGNVGVWNRKTSETSECEIGMKIQGGV